MTIKTTLQKIIKEEYAYLREEHMVFDKMSPSRKKDLSAWLMRQYFNPDKNENSPWYDQNVTESNVLDYISDAGNKFPLSPIQVEDFYRNMKSLQGMVKSKQVSDDLDNLDTAEDSDEEATPKAKYQTSDSAKLTDVGAALGGVTKTTVNNIENSAFAKLQSLLGVSPDKMTPEMEVALEKKMKYASMAATKKFIDVLDSVNGNVGQFLMALRKERLISDMEMTQISDEEIESIIDLSDMSPKEVYAFLKADIENPSGNIMKTFQSIYSRTLFPHNKTGRKPKSETE